MALMRKRSVLSTAMMLALVVTCFLQLHASGDLPEQDGNQVVYSSSSDSGGEASCDMCVCTKSIPPQCRCWDVKPHCHHSCKACACTKSHSPKCECLDIKDHCDKKCTPLRLATDN